MANNQMVNFNSQDVANMYRRNQLAQALQERMNAPTPVHTYQGFQAPISPLTGISKALDMYTAKKYDDQQEEKYQAEKVAAEQKVLNENSRLEQGRQDFVNDFTAPNRTENQMPDARSSIESGIPLDQIRPDVGTGEYTSTPKTPQEKLAFALSQQGSNNPLIANQAKAFVDQGNEDIRAKTSADLAASNRDYTRFIDERTRQDMLSGRDQTQKNTDRTFGQSQSNADRTFWQKEREIDKRYMPTRKENIEIIAQEKAKDNVETTLKRLDENYKKLKDIGGMRTQTGNRLSNLKAGTANALPYAAQGKKESLLRESLDSDLQSLVMPAMKASGMTSKQMDTPAEVARYMKTLGGTNISYEANQPILERLHRELVGRSNNPYNKDTNIDSILDMYAPKDK